MRPVKLGVSEGYILSLKNLQEFQLSVRKGILRNESQTVIYHHSKKRKNIMMVYYSYLLKRISLI